MFESYQLSSKPDDVLALRREGYETIRNMLNRDAFEQLTPNLENQRSRLDLMWNGQDLGIKVQTTGGFVFQALPEFNSATPEVTALTEWFKITCPHRQIGAGGLMSLRFRSGMDGLRGIWIDASREDLEILKTVHKSWIKSALDQGIVIEAGQRFEEWVCSAEDGKTIKSTKPRLRPWLPSYDENQTPIPLVSTIVAFSQPGPLANQTLISAGHMLLDRVSDWPSDLSWGEWGAGNGNLSASFATRFGAKHAWISEPDPKAYGALKQNHENFFADAKIARTAAIQIPENFYLWILDPPRSGFSELIGKLGDVEASKRPKYILIYHCATEGLTKDRDSLTTPRLRA